MDRNFYRFRSEWLLDACPQLVYLALERFEDYPQWWPEVRSLRLLEAEVCEVTCRATLPYTLTFVMRPARRDPEARVLEASMTGDLEGFSRWTMAAEGTGCRLAFDEEVTVHRPLLRRLAPVARRVFCGNHAIMMRHGRAGLARYLVGFDGTPRHAAPVATEATSSLSR